MDELLDTRPHLPTGGWAIVTGKGEMLAITMLSPSTVINDAPGKTITEKLRWVIETGQVISPDRWKPGLRKPVPMMRREGNGEWMRA